MIFHKLGLIRPLLSMTMSRPQSDYAAFKYELDKARNIVALTGAGVSAESGIPVFRGAGGLWRTHRATDLATPQAFEANPALVWEFYHYRREVAFSSYPNNAHKVLAKYEKICKEQGRNFTVITQNVDALHRRAGSEGVVELHGSLDKVVCTKCKQVEVNTDSPICASLQGRGDPAQRNADLSLIPVKDLPKCFHCGGLLRPHIVWFGEQLDDKVLERAWKLIESCNLCLVIGTSSVVYPAAMFAPHVAGKGKIVAEFNMDKCSVDNNFSFYFAGPCGTTLPKAMGFDINQL